MMTIRWWWPEAGGVEGNYLTSQSSWQTWPSTCDQKVPSKSRKECYCTARYRKCRNSKEFVAEQDWLNCDVAIILWSSGAALKWEAGKSRPQLFVALGEIDQAAASQSQAVQSAKRGWIGGVEEGGGGKSGRTSKSQSSKSQSSKSRRWKSQRSKSQRSESQRSESQGSKSQQSKSALKSNVQNC